MLYGTSEFREQTGTERLPSRQTAVICAFSLRGNIDPAPSWDRLFRMTGNITIQAVFYILLPFSA
jgi:hypothetical protein